ncbi:MAG: twin-arginine translocation signal domain-containing protein, partial [Planctomycetota bacterium]
MNRRTFLKATGLSAASLALPASLLNAEELNDHILNQADARIEKYRMASASLKLFGPFGKSLKRGLSISI